MSGAHAHSLAHRAPHIARNAVSAVHRLVQLLGIDLHSFRRAMCGPATLPGDHHLPACMQKTKQKKTAYTNIRDRLNLFDAITAEPQTTV
jgi:hypothetical protein